MSIKDSLRMVVLLGNCAKNLDKTCVRNVMLFDEKTNQGQDIIFKESEREHHVDYMSYPPCHVINETNLSRLMVNPFLIDEDTFVSSFKTEISPLNLCLDWNCDDHNLEGQDTLQTLYLEIPDELFEDIKNQEIGYHLERKSIILQAFRDGNFEFFGDDSTFETGESFLELIEEAGVSSVDSEDYFFSMSHNDDFFSVLDELQQEPSNGQKLEVHRFSNSYEFGEEDELIDRYFSNLQMNPNNCFSHFVTAHKSYLRSFHSFGLESETPMSKLEQTKQECINLLTNILNICSNCSQEGTNNHNNCDTLCLSHMQLGRMYKKSEPLRSLEHFSFAIDNFNQKYRKEVILKTLIDRFLVYRKLGEYSKALDDVNTILSEENIPLDDELFNLTHEQYRAMVVGYRGIFQYEVLMNDNNKVEDYDVFVGKLKQVVKDLNECIELWPRKRLKKECKKYKQAVFDLIEIKGKK